MQDGVRVALQDRPCTLKPTIHFLHLGIMTVVIKISLHVCGVRAVITVYKFSVAIHQFSGAIVTIDSEAITKDYLYIDCPSHVII